MSAIITPNLRFRGLRLVTEKLLWHICAHTEKGMHAEGK